MLGDFQVGSSSHVMSDIEKRERGKFLIMKAAHSTGKLKFDGVETDFVAEDLTGTDHGYHLHNSPDFVFNLAYFFPFRPWGNRSRQFWHGE